MKDRVELNELKHHKGAIKHFLFSYIESNVSFKDLRPHLNRIGNSTLDLYFGTLSVSEIYAEVSVFLENNGITSKQSLKNYIKTRVDSYFNLPLSDGSEWTVRFINRKKFVHVHPSRHSKFSLRCTGPTLKTVIATYLLFETFSPSLAEINAARQQLMLPPVQKIINDRGLHKLFTFFQGRRMVIL